MLHISLKSKFWRYLAPNPSLQQFGPTIWLHIVLFILLLPCATHSALTNREKDALLQIYNAYPALAHPPTVGQSISVDPVPGSAWNSTFDNLCSSDGYEYFGIHCFNGHIDAIDITDAWLTPTGYNFSLISGLEYLTNVSIYYDYGSSSSLNLTIALAMSTQAIHYDLLYHEFSASYFSFPQVIETLYFESKDSHSLVNFTNLRDLVYTGYGLDEFPCEIIPAFASLRSLEVRGQVNLTWFADNIQEFALLTSLTISGTAAEIQSIGSIKFELDPLPLQYFSLSFFQLGNLYTPFDVVINSTTLTSFKGGLLKGSQLELSTPNLKDLWLMSFVNFPDMTQLGQLETLKLSSFTTSPPNFPNLNFSSNMRVLDISGWDSSDIANFERIICSLAQTSQDTFESFSGTLIGVYGGIFQQLPSCFSQFTNMKSFSWDSLTFGPPSSALNGTTFWSYLPRTLTLLNLGFAIADITPIPIDVFATFPLLESLHIATITSNGTLREDFFEALPNLSDFTFISRTNGTVPSKGWHNLKNVYLSCYVDSWNNIDHAPNLKSLTVSSKFLTSIPHDVVFAAAGLVSLRELTIDSNGKLGGPVPTFWSQLPRIRSVHLGDNGFQGSFTLGSISNPDVDIDLSTNSLCALSEVPEPLSLSSLSLRNNSISGTIPNSWGQNLAISKALYLHDNPNLTGTIPAGLMDRKRLQCPYVSFHRTRVSYFGDLTCSGSYLYFSNNPIDLCQNNPVPGKPIDCYFYNVSVCPATGNCTDQWSVCKTIDCTERTFEPISVTPCIDPPPRPIPASFNCPLPVPAFGFVCDDGKWIAPGNIHQPSLSLPPNFGVITINGSLYSGGVITFNGIGTQIEVNQCVEVAPTQIVIELTGKDTSNSVTLLKHKGNNCPTDLSTIPIKVNSKDSGCKRTNASTSKSTPSSLVVVFSVDTSRCNTKWIVLGCVLGSVAVIAVATVLLLDKYNPKFHSLITTGKYK